MASFFLRWCALPYDRVIRCGRPAVFMWLCKLHTIEDHVVLRHATIVSGTNLLKVEESRRVHILQLYSINSRSCELRIDYLIEDG